MWKPLKTLVLHNSRETLARLLNRRIRHLCTIYKMQNVWTFYPKYAMCMMFRCFEHKMIQDDQVWYDFLWCYGSCLQASLSFSFCLKACLALSLLSSFLMQNFTNQDSNWVYAMTTLCHKRWYQDMHHGDMVCMLWEVWSLMCTSHVACNTQMASLDR